MKFIGSKFPRRKVNNLNSELNNRNFKAIIDIIKLGISGITLLLVFLIFVKIQTIDKKGVPSLVQINDGSTIAVGVKDSGFRSDEVLQSFVTDALIMLMSWSVGSPNTKADAGDSKKNLSHQEQSLTIKNTKGENIQIPSSVFYASFAFTEKDGFRDDLLKDQVALMIAKTRVMEGAEKTTLRFRTKGVPESILDCDGKPIAGKWKVPIVADFLRWDMKGANTEKLAFNKDVYVEVIDVPKLPKGKEPNPLEVIMNTMLQGRIQIFDMTEIGTPPLTCKKPTAQSQPKTPPSSSPSPTIKPPSSSAPSPSSTKKDKIFNSEFIQR